MIRHTTPPMAGPTRTQLLVYTLAVFAAFVITLAPLAAAHAAVLDGLTIELRQTTTPYVPPDIDSGDDLGNQPLPGDDNPDNT